MKETLTYSAMAILLVVSVGVFYSLSSKDELSVDNQTRDNSGKLESTVKYSRDSKAKNIIEKSKTLTKVDNNTTTNNKEAKKLASKTKSVEDKDEVQMPKEFESMQQELGSIKQEAIALLEQADNLVNSMNEEDEKLKQESKDAENVIKELEDNNIIDVAAIKQETEKLAKPIAIEDAPQEVKPALERADKARLELEKKLTELKILENGGE